MQFKLKTPMKEMPGYRLHCIRFEMETVDPNFRDNVVQMICAALDGATVQQPEPPEEKHPALGFHKEDDDDDA